MNQVRACIFSVLVFVSISVYAENTTVQLEGLTGALQKNVQINLSNLSASDYITTRRLRTQVEKEIRKSLRALGYYQPTIEFHLEEENSSRDHAVLIAKVSPGKPIIVAAVALNITGDAAQDKDYQKLQKKAQSYVGKVLDQGQYDTLKKDLQTLAWQKGYFDAKLTRHELGVEKIERKSYWYLDFNSGQRYRFGTVNFQGSQIRQDFLENLLPFHTGDFYQSSQLAELNRRLAETGWFNSAIVTPDFRDAGINSVLPLRADLVPRNKNIVETRIGYSSDIGPSVGLNWKKPWINTRGDSLETVLKLSKPEPSIGLVYKFPVKKNPLEQYYLIQGGYKHQNLNDTRSDSSTLTLSRYWNYASGWQRSVNMRWSYDHFTQADVTDNTMLLYPGINITRTRQRGGLMPTWGDTQNYSLDISNQAWGSGVNFLIFQAQNVWIRKLSEKNRFVLRANFGWIESDNFNKVPPSLRFFAGGDRSIRGYKYQSISPVDKNGKLVGASRLLTGSVEYQYNISGKWWTALFVDSGEAVNSFRQNDFKTGAGIGLRWDSPVGPIKFDFATPVSSGEKHDLQFYLGVGPEL